MSNNRSPLLDTDFYKVTHVDQYPKGTTKVYSTWIPRGSKVEGIDEVVAFGFQFFVHKWLKEEFQVGFFDRPLDEVVHEYQRLMRHALGVQDARVDHIAYLHGLGYLPLLIKAVPEGTKVPLRVPMLTIENTDPQCFWLTNAIETLFSSEVWQMGTSATIANEYRKILDYWCGETGGDPELVKFQAHDFSCRGISKIDAAASSGAGHLLSFVGTDTNPAIFFAEDYYGANIEQEMIGTSIPATEHSVMCVSGMDEEITIKRLLEEVYPSGMFSCVMDTWDLFKVVTHVLPLLKNEIMTRDGRIVIRPDSGDPADIICGTAQPSKFNEMPKVETTRVVTTPEEKGVVELLWDIFGGTINEKGFKVLDPHVGVIYGDAINLYRANDICARLAAKGFCSSNIVFGVGSFTYQYQTRDTFEFALKSTYAIVNGVEMNIFKDPATDKNHMKRSLTGMVAVVAEDSFAGNLVALTALDAEGEAKQSKIENLLQPIFHDGDVMNIQTFQEIRERVAS